MTNRAVYIKGTPQQRFWPKVDKTINCWVWTGAIRNDGSCVGYGVFNAGNGKTVKAHRFAYETLRGKIPSSMELDHTCHSNDKNCEGGVKCLHRSCVNPNHLEIVTHSVNASRSSVGARAWRTLQITHCPQGHEYNEDNTYIPPSHFERQCKTCRNERARQWQKKNR